MNEARTRLGYSDTIGCACRMYLSPHEWTWTQTEIESMAMTLVEKDKQCVELCAENEALAATVKTLTHERDAAVEKERERIDALLLERVNRCGRDHRSAIMFGLLRKGLGVMKPPPDEPAF